MMRFGNEQLRRGADGGRPLWLRVVALACLLLVGLASSAQAVHVHGQWLPKNEVHAKQPVSAAQLPSSEASCLLCVAMHSALPAVADVPATVVAAAHAVVAAARTERVPEEPWHYAGFSRPPPMDGTV